MDIRRENGEYLADFVSVEKSCDVSSRTLQALLWSPFIKPKN